MMTEEEKNRIKSKVQQNSYNIWVNAGKKGFLQLCTGLGKSRIMCIAILARLTESPNSRICIGCDNTYLRDIGIPDELRKWGVDPDSVEIACYNTMWNAPPQCDLLILDEYDKVLTPKGITALKESEYTEVLGLTASMTSRKFLESIKLGIPCLLRVPLSMAQEKGVINKINIEVIDLPLSDSERIKYLKYHYSIKAVRDQISGLKAEQRGRQIYDLHTEEIDKLKIKKAMLESRAANGNNRKVFLFDLQTNINAGRALRDQLLVDGSSKVIFFSQHTETLRKLSDNTYYGNTKKNNNINLFNSGEIRDLAVTPKKVGRGISFVGLNNAIGHGYSSSSADFIQALLGRLSRLPVNEVATLYLFVNHTFDDEGLVIECQNHSWFDGCMYFLGDEVAGAKINKRRLSVDEANEFLSQEPSF